MIDELGPWCGNGGFKKYCSYGCILSIQYPPLQILLYLILEESRACENFEMSVRLKQITRIIGKKKISKDVLVKRQTQVLELTWEAQSVSHIIFFNSNF